MKKSKRPISVTDVVLAICVTVFVVTCFDAHATDDHHRTKAVIVEKHDHALVGGLIGAGITYWLMHRYHKRHEVKPTVCETEQTERILTECVAK
jgi:hypothetical protein